MKHFYHSLLTVVFVAPGCFINAQTGIIHGKIIDSSNQNPVEYAYILNYSLQKQIYSNQSGEFNIEAAVGDTMVIYAAGYLYEKVIIDQRMLTSSSFSYKVTIQSYELAEARIPVFGSYEEFRQKFINLDRPKTQTEQLNGYIADLSKIAASEGYEEYKNKLHAEGVTIATVPILTPEEIERKKLAKIVENEQVRDQVYQKFNPYIVKQVTGITNDDEVIEFMVYCNFSDAYVLDVNDYDLQVRIGLKYEEFLNMKKDKKSMENPVNQVDYIYKSLAYNANHESARI